MFKVLFTSCLLVVLSVACTKKEATAEQATTTTEATATTEAPAEATEAAPAEATTETTEAPAAE